MKLAIITIIKQWHATLKMAEKGKKMQNEISMTTITEGFPPHVETDPTRVYKWIAETMIYKHMGGKDIRRIKYHQRYDGHIHATYYISNGTKVEITIPRS